MVDTKPQDFDLAREYVADVQNNDYYYLRRCYENIHNTVLPRHTGDPFCRSNYIEKDSKNPYVYIKKTGLRNDKTVQYVIDKIRDTPFYTESIAKGMTEKELVMGLFRGLSENGDGVFAKKLIPCGTIIARADAFIPYEPTIGSLIANDGNDWVNVSTKMNDLCFYLFQQEYEYADVENIKQHTNVKYMEVNGVKYLVAIKDIEVGEELSRYYGPSYWFTPNDGDVLIEDWTQIRNIVKQKSLPTTRVEKMTPEETRAAMNRMLSV